MTAKRTAGKGNPQGLVRASETDLLRNILPAGARSSAQASKSRHHKTYHPCDQENP